MMDKNYCKTEYLKASLFTGTVLASTLVALMFVNSCSLLEWQDIAEDARDRVPNEAKELLVRDDGSLQLPSQTELISGGISLLSGLVAGWYGRKFKEKKYDKKKDVS